MFLLLHYNTISIKMALPSVRGWPSDNSSLLLILKVSIIYFSGESDCGMFFMSVSNNLINEGSKITSENQKSDVYVSTLIGQITKHGSSYKHCRVN